MFVTDNKKKISKLNINVLKIQIVIRKQEISPPIIISVN